MINRARIILAVSFVTCALLALPSGAVTRQSAALPAQKQAKSALPLPILPLILDFERAPLYFMQWINDSPRYSRIAASIGHEKPPIYLITLTEKDSNEAAHYTNSEARAKALKADGKDAYHTPIDYKEVKNVEQEVSFGIGLRDKHGQPVLWRFIPANNRPSPRGAGLQPLAAMPGLHLRFSDRGTAAGAGTAVQIGEKVYEAEPWPQISAPPHFVAYRGSYVFGMDLSALLLGKETWRVVKAPDELREGAQWTLANGSGRERQLQITRKSGDEITLTEKLAPGLESASLNLVALVTPNGLALRSITLNHRDSGMHITFTPELHLTVDAPRAESEYRIDLGMHEKVSQGSVAVEGKAGVINLRWQPRSPDWAKSRTLNSVINLNPEGYSIEITQQSK